MHYLSVGEVLLLHSRIMQQTGGMPGILSLPALESALIQPRMTFTGEDLYPTLHQKASALGFAIIRNHPVVDGNKRTGHAAMEVFLLLNGFELQAPVDEQEEVIVRVAAGELRREGFTQWIEAHMVRTQSTMKGTD
jgi:death-on-curing protein